MKPLHTYDARLLEYLDGTLTTRQQQILEQQLEVDSRMRARLSYLRSAHNTMRQAITLEQPSRDFTLNVMGNLHRLPLEAPGPSIRKSIMLLAGALIAALGTAILLSTGMFDLVSTPIDLTAVKIPGDFVRPSLPTISVSGRVMLNTVIILNIVLGWIVLDRTILKPLFFRRMSS